MCKPGHSCDKRVVCQARKLVEAPGSIYMDPNLCSLAPPSGLATAPSQAAAGRAGPSSGCLRPCVCIFCENGETRLQLQMPRVYPSQILTRPSHGFPPQSPRHRLHAGSLLRTRSQEPPDGQGGGSGATW